MLAAVVRVGRRRWRRIFFGNSGGQDVDYGGNTYKSAETAFAGLAKASLSSLVGAPNLVVDCDLNLGVTFIR